MDYADATPEPHMTTQSFRGLLEGGADAVASYRPFVSSGLDNFRMVVKQLGEKQYLLQTMSSLKLATHLCSHLIQRITFRAGISTFAVKARAPIHPRQPRCRRTRRDM